jgi:AraC-like DNA-binding protein
METIYIKNMVCPRCIAALKEIMKNLGANVLGIELGEVKVERLEDIDLECLDAKLLELGFQRLEGYQAKLSNQIKTFVLEYLLSIETVKIKLSDYLVEKIGLSYQHLSKVFSETEKNTIEKYFILLRLEKAKERLSYRESITQIAIELGYSSPQALTTQFKSHTGLTPKEFREGKSLRKNLSDI